MVLKKWDKVIGTKMEGCFLEDDHDDSLDFPKELSFLTNFSLDVFSNIIRQKNMIINFPDFKLHPASLFAYIFSADKSEKSVYILADEKGDSLDSKSKFSLNKNHYLLRAKFGNMLYTWFPVFYLKKLKKNEENIQNNSVDYKLSLKRYLPRSKLSEKKKYTEDYALNDEYHPKFIIDTDSKLFSIEKKLEVILKTNDQYLNPENHPIGLIIMENADRFFDSFGKLENFISWFKGLDSDVKLFIHFNNPYMEYIKLLVNELNFAVLPLNKYILENNNYFKNKSKEYFDNLDSSKLEVLNRYNLDSNVLFGKKIDMTISDPIKSGSLDYYFGSAYSTFKKIDFDSVFNINSLHKSRELLFNLYDLTVNPSYLTISFKLNGEWINGSVLHFIENFKRNLHRENSKNRFYIYSFLDSLSNMYYELANCKRVNEEVSYSKIAKDYVLYELIIDLIEKGEKLFVGTYLDTEPNILRDVLKKGNHSFTDSVVPINMKMLIQKPDSEKKGKILILPGIVPEVFISELYKPYKEIIFLTYEGRNNKYLKDQLSRLFGNILEEKQYMDYLKEILEEFGETEYDGILNDFNERFELIEFEEDENITQDIESIEPEFEDDENSIFSMDLNLKEYMDEWKKSKINLNQDFSREITQKHYDTLTFKLMNIQTDNLVQKKLPVNKSYLTFDNIYNIDDAKELKPSELKSGDYIIIIDNDEKKSLLNLIIDLSDVKYSINSSQVEYWKLEFLNYISANNLKYSEVYNIYCNKGGDKTYQTVMQWCKGEVLGPQSAEDLYIIGKILNNGFILNNYQSMFQQISLVRTSHRLVGRKLKKMIKSILTDEYLDISSLNESEYLIYENIQNGIYQIV